MIVIGKKKKGEIDACKAPPRNYSHEFIRRSDMTTGIVAIEIPHKAGRVLVETA